MLHDSAAAIHNPAAKTAAMTPLTLVRTVVCWPTQLRRRVGSHGYAAAHGD